MPVEKGQIRVLVVEDHAPLAEALTFAFGFEADVEVVGVAPTVSRALEMVAASEPDLVLMDVRLGIPAEETARHMAAVVTKLRARSHLEALVIAARAGLLKAVED